MAKVIMKNIKYPNLFLTDEDTKIYTLLEDIDEMLVLLKHNEIYSLELYYYSDIAIYKQLFELLKINRSICMLYINCNKINDEYYQLLSDFLLTPGIYLQYIYLEDHDISIKNTILVIDALKNSSSISQRSNLLIGNQLSERSNLLIGNQLSQRSNLPIGNQLSQRSNLLIGNQLSQRSNLLIGNQLSQRSNLLIGNQLSQRSNLLIGNQLSERSNLPSSGQISKLGLRYNNIDNNTFKYFIKSLKNNNSLTNIEVNMSRNKIDCNNIVKLLKVNTTLTHIALYTNEIQECHLVKKIIDVLKNNPHIVDFYIHTYIPNLNKKISKYCDRNRHNRTLKMLMLQDIC
jgi:hypothetical protein